MAAVNDSQISPLRNDVEHITKDTFLFASFTYNVTIFLGIVFCPVVEFQLYVIKKYFMTFECHLVKKPALNCQLKCFVKFFIVIREKKWLSGTPA